MRRRLRGWIWLLVAVLVFVSVVWIAPLVIVVMTAVKSDSQYTDGGFYSLTGGIGQLWTNVVTAAGVGNLWEGFGNSLLYGIVGAGVAVLISALGAYALVWMKLRFAFGFFVLIYAGTALPFQMYMLPLSSAYKAVGLFDTRGGMLLFYATVCIPFCVFVFRNYFLGMSNEVLEAARVDGAGRLRIFGSVILPLSINPAILLFLTQFLWIWNDLLFGQVLTASSGSMPLMPDLASLSGQVNLAGIPEQMAGALLACTPGLLLFIFLRKRLMQGFTIA